MERGKKVITYPRAETRYLPESLIGDAPRLVAERCKLGKVLPRSRFRNHH